MANRDVSYLVQLLRMIGKIIVGGLVIVFMFSIAGALLSPQVSEPATDEPSYNYVYGDTDSENYLLKLNVMGPILGVPMFSDPGPFGFIISGLATYGYSVKQALKEAAEDDDIKGVFIHMVTPGGTVFGSMAIFEGIKNYREQTGNPVVVYIEGLSASGGVMAMVGADAVYADAGSFIGSIGVIGGSILYYDEPTALQGGILGGGVTTEGGIEQTVIYAGRGKDLGNPYRRITEEEKASLQKGVDSLYRDFVDHVAEARNMSPDIIIGEMGAQIFENKQAEAYGLIDGTRSYDGSIEELARLAEIEDDYKLVKRHYQRVSAWQRLLMWGRDTTPSASRIESGLQVDLCTASRQQALVYFGLPAQLCTVR